MIESKANVDGFTLSELAFVLFGLALIGGIIIPAVASYKKQAQRAACRNSLQILADSSLTFAEDHDGRLTGCPNFRSDDLNWLYPLYAPNLKSYVCASTSNQVRPHEKERDSALVDLLHFAPTKWDQYGHSYEQFGYWGTGSIKTLALVQTHKNSHPNNAYGLIGTRPGAENTWLMADGDNAQRPPMPPNINDYPDEIDHHGADGANVSFVDGHVSWIPRKDFAYRRELSLDQGKISP